METQRPLILLSNDDGYTSKGINELIRFLQPLGQLVVVAPDRPRSGQSMALTTGEPVHYKLVDEREGVTIYKCSGTPADCIKLARHAIVDRAPDLIVGGINHGDNSAVNVHYSGTMGIAIEGCLAGIPSIGFSTVSHAADAAFTPFEDYIRAICRLVLEKGLPPLTCLNVNFPDRAELMGIRVCKQGKGQWMNEWEPCPRKHSPHYFWLTGEFVDEQTDDEQTDRWALAHGYAAITPITVDVTAYGLIDSLKNACQNLSFS